MIEIRTILTHTHKYLLANSVCKKHHENMVQRLTRFIAWCVENDRPALDADTLNAFLTSLEQRTPTLSPHTINGYRANIMAVWSDILGTRIIYKIRRARTPRGPVSGWSLDELAQLCVTAARRTGILPNRVLEATYWQTAIHAGFSTALRYGDLTRVPVDSIAADGTCEVLQSKTAKTVLVRFSPDALANIRNHRQPFVLPTPHTQKWFCEQWRALVLQAGIRPGTFRWLRRSAGSYVDAQSSRGPELLGNTRSVFDLNYKVGEIVRRDPPEPPTIKRAS